MRGRARPARPVLLSAHYGCGVRAATRPHLRIEEREPRGGRAELTEPDTTISTRKQAAAMAGTITAALTGDEAMWSGSDEDRARQRGNVTP